MTVASPPSGQTMADIRAKGYELAVADLPKGATVEDIIARAEVIVRWLVTGR